MNITLLIHECMPAETNKVTVTVNDGTTIEDLLYETCQIADFSKYYPFNGKMARVEGGLPYLIKDGLINLDVPNSQAKVTDFINTFELSRKEIELYTGYPFAGGPGLLALAQIWENAIPVLNGIATFCSIAGINVTYVWEKIRSLFLKKNQPPQTCFDIIYRREMWNSNELANLLKVENDFAKDLLRVLGYKYDQHKMMYIQREDIEEIKDRLTDIKVHDI